jgi:hypothetical protein
MVMNEDVASRTWASFRSFNEGDLAPHDEALPYLEEEVNGGRSVNGVKPRLQRSLT